MFRVNCKVRKRVWHYQCHQIKKIIIRLCELLEDEYFSNAYCLLMIVLIHKAYCLSKRFWQETFLVIVALIYLQNMSYRRR